MELVKLSTINCRIEANSNSSSNSYSYNITLVIILFKSNITVVVFILFKSNLHSDIGGIPYFCMSSYYLRTSAVVACPWVCVIQR